jgi:hypothetical protein
VWAAPRRRAGAAAAAARARAARAPRAPRSPPRALARGGRHNAPRGEMMASSPLYRLTLATDYIAHVANLYRL